MNKHSYSMLKVYIFLIFHHIYVIIISKIICFIFCLTIVFSYILRWQNINIFLLQAHFFV